MPAKRGVPGQLPVFILRQDSLASTLKVTTRRLVRASSKRHSLPHAGKQDPIDTSSRWARRRSIRIPRSGTGPSPSRRDAPSVGLAGGRRINLRYTIFAGAPPDGGRLERTNELRAKAGGHLATGHTGCTLVQGGPPCPYHRRSPRRPSRVARRTVRRPGGSRCPFTLRATLPDANIVVNGDADMVILLEATANHGRVACSGAIEEPAVRDAIVRTVDGGEEAFRLRRRKYGF